ncbi:MAG: hypothetical protein GYA50_08575 [Eubacteriaceae bacterium]|nr:hypothetical protein [Eubacteriaceae bacterium]
MKTENNYGFEQMSKDARTYIALGIEWIRYHTEKMNKAAGAKKDKLNAEMNEYILKMRDKLDFFERAAGADIREVIEDLTEEEKQFVTLAKNLHTQFIEGYREQTKKDKSNIEYMRRIITKIKKAQDRLYKAELKDDMAEADRELENCYKQLGDTFMLYRLEPYIDSFTPEEQEYIFSGRMAILAGDYAKEAEKARRFLLRCEKIRQTANIAASTGMEFVKMEECDEAEGEKAAQ